MADWRLQQSYAFSEVGLDNRWHNLFVDRRPAIAAERDEDILAYVRVDNYQPLRAVWPFRLWLADPPATTLHAHRFPTTASQTAYLTAAPFTTTH